ncbi:MAG: hypothetical protein NPIRA05_22530 [Nitrospirales bacterium]|nr:MAG: hypothetical protein NPIRA05_22530 [Nitrospirales bacterium]
MAILNETIDIALSHYSTQMATNFEADVFSFIGGIRGEYLSPFRAKMEDLASRDDKPQNLVFLLHTPGGVAEIVEKMVDIIRHHYQEVWFVVPDMAMSAGTILCMSGDKIYMDYSSALGPIDPQIPNSEGILVPALGYLDQVDKMIEKSESGTLTDAEFAILQNQDLAMLRRYEQARDLSISLLKDWLVKYKFKDWDKHSSNGEDVTEEEKKKRALEIAEALTNHKRWNSHGRMIGINTLTNDLKLRIEDYTGNVATKNIIRQYSDLLLDCIQNRRVDHFFHTQRFIEPAD